MLDELVALRRSGASHDVCGRRRLGGDGDAEEPHDAPSSAREEGERFLLLVAAPEQEGVRGRLALLGSDERGGEWRFCFCLFFFDGGGSGRSSSYFCGGGGNDFFFGSAHDDPSPRFADAHRSRSSSSLC